MEHDLLAQPRRLGPVGSFEGSAGCGDRAMRIGDIRLLEKHGGKSGSYVASP